MITQHADHLYGSMLQQLSYYRDMADPKKGLENSFQTCADYWKMLERKMQLEDFTDQAEEIEFFKKWKPRFIAEMEYYSLRYHAELFTDGVTDPAAIKQFFTRESARLGRFIQDNQLLCDYYHRGGTDKDAEWFVKKDDNSDESRSDQVIGTLLALQRYTVFITHEMKRLKV